MRFILLLLLPVLLLGSQKDCQRQVKHIAKQYTNYYSTLVAIALTESSCGLHILGDDSKSLGIMQLQVRTVRDVIRWYPNRLSNLINVSDARLRTTLLTDVPEQIKIASLLFEHHRLRHGYFGAISRYNGGKYNTVYYNIVQKWKTYYLRSK